MRFGVRIYRCSGVVAVPLLAGATVLSGCGANTDAQSGDETAPPGVVARVINVEVTRVVTTDFIDYIRITGEAEALYDATVSAEESGSVVELLATKGAQVARGQALVRLDDAVLRAQVNEARASARFAEEQYERQGRLWETDSIGSELTYLQSRYAAEMAAARLEGLEARLAKTVIRAPVSGILDDRFVEVGEMATPGTPIVRVVNTNRVKVSGGVPERFAPYVARGDTARVVFDIMPDRELIGLISYVSSTVDERSRTFQIEVVLDNPNSVIKPHMVANVEVMRESSTDVIVVPQQVVLRSSDGYRVFVALPDGDGFRAAARTVRIGRSYNNQVLIESGLEPGDLIVTLGQQLIDEGSLLQIVNEYDAEEERV